MKLFTLRSVIDDVLLMIRNNNVSESEDFSRAQIALWILAYKAAILKKKQEKDKEDGKEDEEDDDDILKTIGPVELIDEQPLDDTCLYRKRTKEKLPELSGSSDSCITSVQDQEGCPIQKMNEKRRHFHFFRKYTFGELGWWYENEYIYLEGLTDLNRLRFIWVTGAFTDSDEDGDEDDIKIPGWMIPDIKAMIIKNELAFILNMPSDDDNNSTLASVKPKGPQQDEK